MAKKGNIENTKEEANKSICPNYEAVKAVLLAYPHVHTIHVNESGEWHFMPRPSFVAYTREEILNG